MKNKVLIRLIVPEMDTSYDVFIPTSELVWRIKKLLMKSVSDLSGGVLDMQKNYVLLNKDTGKIYSDNLPIYETDIRNATELVLLEEKTAGVNF